MSFWDLLTKLQANDVRVALYLDVDMPADTPGALVEALREYKPILLMKLAREAQFGRPRPRDDQSPRSRGESVLSLAVARRPSPRAPPCPPCDLQP